MPSDSVCFGNNPDDIQPFANLFDLKQSTTKASDEGTTASRRTSTRTRGRRGDGDGRVDSVGVYGDKAGDRVGIHNDIEPPKEYYTNAALYQLLKPDGEAIPYAYNDFEWPHCDVSRGVGFSRDDYIFSAAPHRALALPLYLNGSGQAR